MFDMAIGVNYEYAFDWSTEIQSGLDDKDAVRIVEKKFGRADVIFIVERDFDTPDSSGDLRVRVLRPHGDE